MQDFVHHISKNAEEGVGCYERPGGEGMQALNRRGVGRSPFVATAIIGLALSLAPLGSLQAQGPPQRSIILIEVWDQYSWRAISGGTAFFISSDGRALTSSHVVYPVRIDRRYRLLAIVGREFYGASLTCASELPYDPTKTMLNIPSRDVAEIRLTRPDFPFDQITHNNIPYAMAHRGPLPAFPALAFGPEPQVGDRLRVIGYGAVSTHPLPYEWSVEGEASHAVEFVDGTPGFIIFFATRPAAPGHSGAPVLNAVGQVVGLLDWGDPQEPKIGTAIGSSALDPACRH